MRLIGGDLEPELVVGLSSLVDHQESFINLGDQ
jgi:hypothetical protein